MDKETFTATRIDAMRCKPGQNQSFYWVPKTPGFGRPSYLAGAKSFIFESRLHGQTMRGDLLVTGKPTT